MPMLRALRMLNAIESGSINGDALETLLADPGRFSEWSVLVGMRSQVRRMLASPITMDAVCASPRAVGALFANPRAEAVLYAKASLAVLAPNAWGVYAPRPEFLELGGTNGNEVSRWRNATGIAARDMLQATSANRPLLRSDNAPLAGMQALQFSSASQKRLQSAEAFNQPTAYTVFVVYRRGNTNIHGLFGGTSSGTGGFGVRDAPSKAVYENNGNIAEFSNAGGGNGAWALGRYRRQSSAALYHSINGGSDSSVVTSGIPSFQSNTGIGSGYLQGHYYLEGDIAEVWLLAGNGDAASPEVVRVTNLLKAKYKL